MILPHSSARADAEPEPRISDYTILAAERFIWMDEGPNLTLSTDTESQQFKWVMDDRLQTPENLYLASSYYSNYLLDSGRPELVRPICQRYPPKPDHHQYQANCILAEDLPIMETAQRLEAIADAAQKQFPNRLIASPILNVIGARLSNKGHVHESIRFYKKAVEALPADAEFDIAESKLNLAFSYANSLLSEPMQRLSVKYYNEVLDWYKKQEPTPYILYQIKWVSYNKAIGHLFLFSEYDEALKALDAAEGHESLAMDIKVFKAYVFAKNKQPLEARNTLKMVNLKSYGDKERLAFLSCYVDLTKRLLGDSMSVQSCLNLESPQMDVLLDLTDTLSQLNLEPRDENRMWRSFYHFFSKHLKPDFQNSMATASSEAELQQEKAESRLKDLKLKNLSLYQDLSYAMIAVAVVCGLALFLAIRSWRESRRHAQEMSAGKARLQHIVDSIEEGLIVIRPGMILEAEESRHLLDITGQKNLQGAKLQDLMALTGLSADRQAITVQCLEAVMGESELSWELNQSNLPAESQISGRDIAFYWQPLLGHGVIQSVLLVMRDVTTIHTLEKQSQKAREQADHMLDYAREILSSHPRAVGRFLGELPQLMQNLSHAALVQKDMSTAKRIAHSIKGTARTLRLHDLQNKAHQLEDELRSDHGGRLEPRVDELRALAETYTAAMQHVLGHITDVDVRSLFDLVAQHKPALERQLASAGVRLGSLVVEESLSLSRFELKTLADVVLHALTNAADHGFVLRAHEKGRPSEARFSVSAFPRGDQHVLVLRDNGAGLDHQKIQEQAQKHGWKPEPGHSWSEFLFLEGVSTADHVTVTSGRGVGLSVIGKSVQTLHGRVQLLDNDQGPGSMLEITWPAARDIAA
ncbi:MAG TPA: Hpt domain-containing protein [Oligoflexus sp.]|uniref:Hpt domain-containing protein n=1 Tax=Oligoflexus sp. TaxID=1971216 RepID=UPI002D80BE66|nr:Hpt domain-containing protein [Oligoflexus sp.]HET9239099.1 Hpt domain-containing protein [Oligoflexus sp.]